MRKDWTTCDGTGGLDAPLSSVPRRFHASVPLISRRNALALGSIGLLGFLANRRSALSQVALSQQAESRDLLVVIFLRGGADGLSVVPPHGEDAFHRGRPTLGLGAPKRSVASTDKAIDLDGFFGLHPTLAPLVPEFKEGSMAVVHAVGSADQSRSHFEAMSAMERGLPNAVSGAASGWLARFLTETQTAGDSPLRAVALGSILPDSLRGGVGGSAIRSVEDFQITGKGANEFQKLLKIAYASGDDEAQRAGRDTLRILDSLGKLDQKEYRGKAGYPESELGEGLKQVAILAKAGVGLEVACLDKGGWDTHFAQGGSTGLLAGLLDDLARSIVSFTNDMGERMKRTTVLVMTEFGRRAYENSTLGTDHGRGSMMFLIGGGIKGGKVYGEWPGLEEHQLEDGDLRVTTDYRTVLSEVLERRMHFASTDRIFEGLRASSIGVCA